MIDIKGLEAFEKIKRLIIVAAHPDDMETICGGTVSLLVEKGVKIFSVNCTLGDIGSHDPEFTRSSLATARLSETEEAARILGIEQTYNLRQHDGELVSDLELRSQIANLYRQTQADTLFTFDPFFIGQIHPDHRAAGQAALDAYMPSKMPLYRPEQLAENGTGLGCLEQVFLFISSKHDVIVDVTGIYATKMAGSMAHISQFPAGEKSLEWMKEMNRKQGEAINATYAESFRYMEVW